MSPQQPPIPKRRVRNPETFSALSIGGVEEVQRETMASDRDQSKPHRPPTNGHPRIKNVALPFLELVRHAKLTLSRLKQRTDAARRTSGSTRPDSKEISPPSA